MVFLSRGTPDIFYQKNRNFNVANTSYKTTIENKNKIMGEIKKKEKSNK